MHQSAHIDTFTRDNLPVSHLLPEFCFDLPELQYPERLNATSELLDRHVTEGRGDRICVVSHDLTWTYAALAERVNRIANALTRDLGLVPGNRVLTRAGNTPLHAAAILAVIKAGGVAVPTMPLLRAKELGFPLSKARVALALCDARLLEELEKAQQSVPHLGRIVTWGCGKPDGLEALMARPGYKTFAACDTARDDVCLIGFTSGTTGEPKGTMHFHRDLLAICDTYGRHVLEADASDLFIGSPPLAFTFGLGGLLLFPLRIGASTVLLEKAPPDELLAAIARFGATVCFTAPTAYRAMLAKVVDYDITCLRKCVSAGEALPKVTFDDWREATGLTLLDGIGATEMLHIFIGAPERDVRAGSTGLAVPGYQAKVIDDDGREVMPGVIGRLAVRGPTGCRYLADDRQSKYVQDGWNITGDTYVRDREGYFWYQARSDDMIIAAGYNIAGPEVETCLLMHPAVAECGVVGSPDRARGTIVKAYVVLRPGYMPGPVMTNALQEFVKREIAPYKYPRAIAYVHSLPRTGTGKLQRHELRRRAEVDARGIRESSGDRAAS